MVVCKPAISSLSLGRASVHHLPTKLLQAEKHGIEGIELFHEDLEYIAKALPGDLTPENDIEAAHVVRQLCVQHSITIICLQPFWYDEGIRDPTEHFSRIAQLKHRMQLAQILHTDLILIPSTFLSADLLFPDLEARFLDLREAADLGAQQDPIIRFAYEGLCWGTYVDTWDACWEVVKSVDRPNFGICLDTFNIAGRVYADPTDPSGKSPNAERDLKASIERLIRTVDVEKVFLVQVADAEKLSSPIIKGHEYYSPAQPARMSWSRNCRLFYGEEEKRAYLPVKDIAQAIFHGLGFRGWVINELFSRSVWNPDPATPAEHARRAAEAWNRLVKDCNLEIAPKTPLKDALIPAESWEKLVTDCKMEAMPNEIF
ncbi:MAG: hypothetical protein Q9203_004960 [Teloschistes exilis]|nr:MAG: hypothetical protein LQ350_007831 [Niorma chrysophthalma]